VIDGRRHGARSDQKGQVGAGVERREALREQIGQRAVFPVRQIRSHLLLGHRESVFSLHLDQSLQSLRLFDCLPEQVGERDRVNLSSHLLETGSQQLQFPAQFPLLRGIVPKDRKRKVGVDGNSHRLRRHVALEMLNAFFE
jgi:hypothetical protein